MGSAAWFALVLIAFLIGYIWGGQSSQPQPPGTEPPSTHPAPTSAKKTPEGRKTHDELGKPKR